MNAATSTGAQALFLGPVERIAISDAEEYIRSSVSGQIRRIHRKVTDILLRVGAIADLPSLSDSVYIALELKLDRALPRWLSSALRYDPRYQQIKAQIEELHTAGFFISVARHGLQAPAASTVPKRISCIAIPTRARPDRLADLMTDIIADLDRRQRAVDVEILVVDDARERNIQRANVAAVCAAAQRSSSVSVRYAGVDEKLEFARRLSAELGSDAKNIAEALLGPPISSWTLGANRNAILLDTIGRCVLMVDDDFKWSLSSSPLLTPTLILGPENAPLDMYVFKASDEAQRFALQYQSPLGILECHESVLGKPITEIIREAKAVGTDSPCPHLLTSVALGQGKITLSYTGFAGDCAMYSSLGTLISTSAETRRQIRTSPEQYQTACNSRFGFRAVRATHIVHGPPWFGVAGVDNSVCLPPFIPEFQNEDYIFGYIVATAFQHHYSAHLPYALAHIPPDSRDYGSILETATSILPTDMLRVCLEVNADFARVCATQDNLIKLGAAAEAIAAQRPEDFRDHVVQRYISNAMQEMVAVESAKDRSAPDFLRKGLDEWLSARRVFLSSPNRIVPHLPCHRNDSDAWRRTQEFVRSYATLLQSWPDVYFAASKLHSSGLRLSRSLN